MGNPPTTSAKGPMVFRRTYVVPKRTMATPPDALEMVPALVVSVLEPQEFAVLVAIQAQLTHARMVMSVKGMPLEHLLAVQRRTMGMQVDAVATLFARVVCV